MVASPHATMPEKVRRVRLLPEPPRKLQARPGTPKLSAAAGKHKGTRLVELGAGPRYLLWSSCASSSGGWRLECRKAAGIPDCAECNLTGDGANGFSSGPCTTNSMNFSNRARLCSPGPCRTPKGRMFRLKDKSWSPAPHRASLTDSRPLQALRSTSVKDPHSLAGRL